MLRWPLILALAGLALHFPGWLWHDMFHAHEGLATLQTQAIFYLATAILLAGALMGASRSTEPRVRWSFAAVLIGALIETAGWIWDFAAHFAGDNSQAAHATVYAGAAIAVFGTAAAVIVRPRARGC